MLSFVIRRLLLTLATVAVVTILVFLAVRVSGDPVSVIAPDDASPELLNRIREEYGLNAPLPVQYAQFIGELLRGDLGTSFHYREPVSRLVWARVGPTLSLLGATMLIGVLLAIPLGVTAAAFRGSRLDQAIQVVATIGMSMPVFWSGLLLILYVALRVQWIPTGGYGDLRHVILPASALGLKMVAELTRLTRSSVLECLSEDYVRTAVAKGLRGWNVLYKHVLRNAAIPVVTMIGLNIGSLISGAVVIENIFSWPGMGTLVINAVGNRDYPVVQGTVLIFVASICLINLVLDLIYGWLDPRIRFS